MERLALAMPSAAVCCRVLYNGCAWVVATGGGAGGVVDDGTSGGTANLTGGWTLEACNEVTGGVTWNWTGSITIGAIDADDPLVPGTGTEIIR